MRRLLILGLVVACVGFGDAVSAGVGADRDNETGVITAVAVAEANGVYYSTGSGPKCTWARFSQGQYEDFFNFAEAVPDVRPPATVPVDELTPEQLAERERLAEEQRQAEERERQRRAIPSVVVKPQAGEQKDHGVYSSICPTTGFTVRFVSLDIDVIDLIPGIRRLAEGQIQPPIPDVNPAAADGGFVNLGMWLAVEPVTVEPVTAEAGPAWITVTPTHLSIGFEFGNGDVETCAGFGDPITDMSVFEQSDVCGYTYRQPSPDNAPYLLTTITTWDLPYDSSDGPDTLGPFSRDADDFYDVDEIQTVGRSN